MPREKILVVEDEGIIAEDIKGSLIRLGYTVPAIAASGEEAIRKSEEFNPDLVLMDIVLQGEIDGIEAAKQICTRFNIPVVYLTAYSDEEMLERAKITEPIGYILKPYNEKELNATIAMALYQYKTGRRRQELRYIQILESMPDAVVICGDNGNITIINAETERLSGYRKDELIGKPVETLIPERFRKAHVGHRARYYSDPKTRPMGILHDLYMLRKDGSELAVDISLSPFRTEEGLFVISDIRDITVHKKLEEERRCKERHLAVQYAVTRALDESANLLKAAPKIIQAVCENTGWDMGVIWTIDHQANLLRCMEIWRIPSVEFTEFEEVSRSFTFSSGIGMPGRVWASRKPEWIVDVPHDTNFPRAPYAARAGLHSAFGFPILLENKVLGVIEFFSREIRKPDNELLQVFVTIGSQIGQLIQRKQDEEVVKKSEGILRTMLQTSASVIICLSSDHKILEFNSEAERLYGRNKEDVLGKDYFELFLPKAVWDGVDADIKKVLTGEPTKGYENPIRTVDGSERILKWYVSRIPAGEEQFGVMAVGYDMTDIRQSEEQIHHLAYYDLLTDLPNRLLLRDNIDRAITAARRDNRPFALFIMNLSRFKEINNTLGHQNGDIILQGVARSMKDTLSEADTIARMGGDDFAVLMTNIDADNVPKMMSNIMSSLAKPFSLEGLSLNISASTGISIFPGHGEDADTLIRRAYIALDAAKTTESDFCIYTPEYDKFTPEHLALMGELRSAIELNQLFLLYQPKVDIRTGMAIGVEALVRWQHPQSGIIPPDKFISLAEKCGLIRQLTFWVLREAFRQLRGWHKAGLDVSIAVNLSVRSLNAKLILDQIKGLLSTWGISPGLLRLEITESIIMQSPEIAMEIITELTKMGVKFSIDDFGTGYSSLSYLQRLPVDELKIDKSFVMNMIKDANSNAIVGSIIELGHSLGLKVVAEGVENKEILDRLTLAGCDIAQGYFFSKPIPHAEITAWLNKQV